MYTNMYCSCEDLDGTLMVETPPRPHLHIHPTLQSWSILYEMCMYVGITNHSNRWFTYSPNYFYFAPMTPNVANIVKTNSFLSDRQSSDAVRRGLGFSHSVIIRDRLCKCNPQTQSLTRAFYAIFECQRPLSAQRCSARIKTFMSIPLKCCEQLAVVRKCRKWK